MVKYCQKCGTPNYEDNRFCTDCGAEILKERSEQEQPKHIEGFSKSPYILPSISALLVFIGAFLPWRTITTAFGSVSANGVDGDGIFTLILSLAALGIIYPLYTGKSERKAAIAAIIIIGIAVTTVCIINLPELFKGTGTGSARMSIGVGFWLTVIGGLGLILSGARTVQRKLRG